MYHLYKTEFFSQNFFCLFYGMHLAEVVRNILIFQTNQINVWIILGLAQNKICGKDLRLRDFNYLMDLAAIGFQGFL